MPVFLLSFGSSVGNFLSFWFDRFTRNSILPGFQTTLEQKLDYQTKVQNRGQGEGHSEGQGQADWVQERNELVNQVHEKDSVIVDIKVGNDGHSTC